MTKNMSLVAGVFVLAISMHVDAVQAQAQFFVQSADELNENQQESQFRPAEAETVLQSVESFDSAKQESQFVRASHSSPQPTTYDQGETTLPSEPIQEFIPHAIGNDFVFSDEPIQTIETIESPIIETYHSPSIVSENVPGKRVHTSVGVSGLLLDRGLGRNIDFSTNGAGSLLSSSDNGGDVLAGVDTYFARRRATGIGWEARYFGLYPSDETTQLGISPTTLLPGLAQLGATTSGTGPTATVVGPSAADVFDASDNHILIRQTEIFNAEFNLLRNLGPRWGATTSDILVGVRYLEFGETLLYEAINIPEGGVANPITADHFSTAENQLAGIQLGTRAGYRFGRRMMLHIGMKGGVYNNKVNTQQRVDYTDRTTGVITNPVIAGGELSGQEFNFGAETNVKSLLGEADLSISFQTSMRSRIRVGYRIIGITDVAFASNQIRNDFTDNAILTPNIDGDLVMQGGFFGLEFAR